VPIHAFNRVLYYFKYHAKVETLEIMIGAKNLILYIPLELIGPEKGFLTVGEIFLVL